VVPEPLHRAELGRDLIVVLGDQERADIAHFEPSIGSRRILDRNTAVEAERDHRALAERPELVEVGEYPVGLGDPGRDLDLLEFDDRRLPGYDHAIELAGADQLMRRLPFQPDRLVQDRDHLVWKALVPVLLQLLMAR